MTNKIEFMGFPKMARLSREIIVSEKIDGTNAQVYITEDGTMRAGSRTRWITPEDDNFGFAKWVDAHRDELLTLGPGRHFGEWRRKRLLVSGDAKAQIVRFVKPKSDTAEGYVAKGKYTKHSNALQETAPRTTTQYCACHPRGSCPSRTIIRCAIVIGVITILTPFFYIAAHVVQAKFVGFFFAYRMGFAT